MTVPYTFDANSGFGSAFKSLWWRWKGSIFKLVWPELCVFLFLYSMLSILYRFALYPEQQRLFEKIAIYCEKYGTLIPVSFVLGFYVSLVIGRWWAQYKVIPWIDTLAIWVNTCIKGHLEEDRLLRRSICRYACLAITQCFTLISIKTKKRFPTLDHLVAAGLLLESEKETMETIVAGIPNYQTHWIPFVWITTIVAQARMTGKITSDTWMRAIIDETNKLKDLCNLLLCFDRIRVPLVYTQVVTFAVYSYFLSCLMGRQWIGIGGNSGTAEEPKKKSSGAYGVADLDLIVPIFTVLQFVFYIGWLRVAQSLVNPFGDDDYDFELNWMVDRHLQVAYTIVDRLNYGQNTPDLQRDPYWDEVVPPELPHTLASLKCSDAPPQTSTSKVVISEADKEIINPTVLLSIPTVVKSNLAWKHALDRAKGRNAWEIHQNTISVDQLSEDADSQGHSNGGLGLGNGSISVVQVDTGK